MELYRYMFTTITALEFSYLPPVGPVSKTGTIAKSVQQKTRCDCLQSVAFCLPNVNKTIYIS